MLNKYVNKFICLSLLSALFGCAESDNAFYYDLNCDGIPKMVIRLVVDVNRQTVLYQVAKINGKEFKETSASILRDCKVVDSKNFVCLPYYDQIKNREETINMSNGVFFWSSGGERWADDDCTYKKTFWGYEKISDANVKDAKSLPIQSK